jgi:branched-chain amino acid aminotransferase
MTAKTIWLDGDLVDWDDATVHVTSFGLNYGIGFLEGIRCYSTPAGPAIFRLADHLRRLRRSAAIYGVRLPHSEAEIAAACKLVVTANGLQDCYLRPLVFMAESADSADILAARFRTAVIASPHGPLGGDTSPVTRRALISSFQRMPANAMPPAAKATGQYLNSFLAQREALRAGYDEAILLNTAGFVADGWAHNIFVLSGGTVTTPPVRAGALPGITRDTIMKLAADDGIPACEQDLVRSDLYLADECFLTGTAACLMPVTSIDGRAVGTGDPGPRTARLAELYDAVTHGTASSHQDWLDYLP